MGVTKQALAGLCVCLAPGWDVPFCRMPWMGAWIGRRIFPCAEERMGSGLGCPLCLQAGLAEPRLSAASSTLNRVLGFPFSVLLFPVPACAWPCLANPALPGPCGQGVVLLTSPNLLFLLFAPYCPFSCFCVHICPQQQEHWRAALDTILRTRDLIVVVN